MVSSSNGGCHHSLGMVIVSMMARESGSPCDDCFVRVERGLTKASWHWMGSENTQPMCAVQGCHQPNALNMGSGWASLLATTSKSGYSLSLASSFTLDGKDCHVDILIGVRGCDHNHVLDSIDQCGNDHTSVHETTSGGCRGFCFCHGCGVCLDTSLTLSAVLEYHQRPSGRGWPGSTL